MFEHTIILKY